MVRCTRALTESICIGLLWLKPERICFLRKGKYLEVRFTKRKGSNRWNETEIYDVLWDTYGYAIDDGDLNGVAGFNMLIVGSIEEGIEDEMIAYAKRNPNATIQDVTKYYLSLITPLEYTDDEDDE